MTWHLGLRRMTNNVLLAGVFAMGSLVFGDLSTASAQSSNVPEFHRSLRSGGETSIMLPPNQDVLLTLPLATSRFDRLNPVCRFRFEHQRQGPPSSGVCNPAGRINPVPEYLYYGDLRVDVATQCQRLENCLLDNTHGESISGQQCDEDFRTSLQTQCKSAFSDCENVEQHCLLLVSEISIDVAEASELRVSPAPPEPPAQPVSTGGQKWVYVGEFREAWVSSNFDVNAMIAPGDTITASKYVNVRSDHLRLNQDSGRWENAPKVGVVRPGETVRISDVEDLGKAGRSAHIWARIE
ncbi:MAG: hypothetical protein AAF362_09935 [Pseudomonadota bacterium]